MTTFSNRKTYLPLALKHLFGCHLKHLWKKQNIIVTFQSGQLTEQPKTLDKTFVKHFYGRVFQKQNLYDEISKKKNCTSPLGINKYLHVNHLPSFRGRYIEIRCHLT